jgi:uncharacterized repeat protein (TIGR03803 family)
LVADASGALYGTTNIGGSANFGTVFKLTPNASGYSESILYSFQGGLDGRTPATALVADKRGALFGTTLFGGGSMTCKSGCGTVFKLTPTASGYRESVLHRFTAGTADGFYPDGTLLVEAGGSLLGTTEFGGTSASCISPGEDRCGTVFALKPTRSGYKERIVYNFQGPPNDGAWPMAGLVRGAGGMLYGTTSLGGSGTYKYCLSGSLRGCGATFRLVPSKSGYRESLLYSFRGGTDGYFPYAGVTAGPHGTLFGTTYYGGCLCFDSLGTVFELVPHSAGASGYNERVLYGFEGPPNGADPAASVIVDERGALFGTTPGGGSTEGCSCGTVFKVTP